MKDTKDAPGSFKAWLMAARPRTLPASASGVIIGSALAFLDGGFHPLRALAALVVALALQVASNLANDVFDYERGADAKRSQGPTRVTQAGLLSARQVKVGLVIAVAVAALAGLWLASQSSWWLLLVGFAAIVAAVIYTAGPWPLSYLGLGDVFVFVFFGLASVVGTYFTQTGRMSLGSLLLSLPPGLIIVAILVVNNLRDIEEDREVGKRTLAVRFGASFSIAEYNICIVMAYAAMVPILALDLAPAWTLLVLLSLPQAYLNIRLVSRERGRPLNVALGRTGMLALLWALLFAAGIVVDQINR